MIRIGILGAGRVIQNRYVEVFRDELKNVQVVLVCDHVRRAADMVAAELGAGAVYHRSDLLRSRDIDVVLIATESGKHYRHSLDALNAGKHVIVEKPPAMTVDQVKEVEALAGLKSLMYAVVFQNRLNPAMKKLKETFDAGRFGKPVLATIRLRWCRYQDYYDDGWHGTWAMDGGVINQQAIHHLDALQWVCGPVEQVSAMQGRLLNDLEAEDTTVAALRLESGALGVIEATTAARPEDFEASISVVGEKGMAVIGGIALNRIDEWRFVSPEPGDREVPERCSQDVPTGYGLSHGPLVREIADRLSAGRIDPPITGRDTLATLGLVHALYRSSEDQRSIRPADNLESSRLGKE